MDDKPSQDVIQPNTPHLVAVDDDDYILAAWRELMVPEGFKVTLFNDPIKAYHYFSEQSADVVMLDLRMPGMDGTELLTHIKATNPGTEVIISTAYGSIEKAVESIKRGAYDFITKPIADLEAVVRLIRQALDKKRLFDRNKILEEQLAAMRGSDKEIVGDSREMVNVKRLIERLSRVDTTVLICGESGTGKELVARSIHRQSQRSDKPFIPINCASLSEGLLESELFGHVKGAFTGATGSRRGLFETAAGGTILLDEIGDTPPNIQVSLLRVLQEGEIRPVGADHTRKVDVRVIAATNVDLKQAVEEGRFREDLYYRIATFRIDLPSLRQRRSDIPTLAASILKSLSVKCNADIEGVEPEAYKVLEQFDWPGNVRELQNVLEHGVVLATGRRIKVEDLPAFLVVDSPKTNMKIAAVSDVSLPHVLSSERWTDSEELPPYSQARDEIIQQFDIEYLQSLLKKSAGNISAAARISSTDRSNLRRLLKRYNIDPNTYKSAQD